jgi:hypothetical protein
MRNDLRSAVVTIDRIKKNVKRALETPEIASEQMFEGAAFLSALTKATEELRHCLLILDRPAGVPATASIEQIEEAIRAAICAEHLDDPLPEGYM